MFKHIRYQSGEKNEIVDEMKTGNIGLNRVPSPPAMITAFISFILSFKHSLLFSKENKSIPVLFDVFSIKVLLYRYIALINKRIFLSHADNNMRDMRF